MSVYVPPKRPAPWGPILTATVPPPDPQEPDDMTPDAIRRYISELGNDLLFGAFARFHGDVLPRDRPLDAVIPADDGSDMWTGDVTTGGANGIFNRSYISEYLIARDKGRTPAEASGDGYDAALLAYQRAVGIVPPPVVQPPGQLRGPISVNQRDFEVPGL